MVSESLGFVAVQCYEHGSSSVWHPDCMSGLCCVSQVEDWSRTLFENHHRRAVTDRCHTSGLGEADDNAEGTKRRKELIDLVLIQKENASI